MSNIIVIGDRFKNFSDRKSIWTVNDYLNDAKESSPFLLGQGLTFKNFEAIQSQVGKNSQVLKEITHQHNDRNVLIFNFSNTGERCSQASIYIRGEHDFLQDHITGIHVSGMILVESARQFFIVSLMNDGYSNDRFILNSISTSFLSYVFPTEILMQLSYKFLKNTTNEKKIIANILALQNGNICAEFEITSTLIPNRLAALNEQLSAKEFKKKLEMRK